MIPCGPPHWAPSMGNTGNVHAEPYWVLSTWTLSWPNIGFGTFHGGPNFVEHLFLHLLFGACTIINQKWDCDMVFLFINFPEIKRFEVLKLTDQRELAGRWRFWRWKLTWRAGKRFGGCGNSRVCMNFTWHLFPCPWNLVSSSIEPLLTWAHWVSDLHDIAW